MIHAKENLRFARRRVEIACLLFVLSAWSADAQSSGGPIDSGKPACPNQLPALSGLTYNEDDTKYAAPECRAGLLNSFKYIPLRRENEEYYVSFGLWIRERSEYFSNLGLGSGPPGNAYPMHRYYGHLDLHLGDRFRFFGELGSSIETGRNGGPRPLLDKENLYVHQGFFDTVLWRSGKNKVTLRAGRQEVELGSHYLVSVRDGRNIRRSFDGFRLTSEAGDWTIDAFALRPVLDNAGYFDDPPNQTQSFWGVYAVRPFRVLPGGNIDLYYFGLENKKVVIDGKGAGQDHTETVGTRSRTFSRGSDGNAAPSERSAVAFKAPVN